MLSVSMGEFRIPQALYLTTNSIGLNPIFFVVFPYITMFQSKLFSKTRKESPTGESSKNADLLIRAGFIHKEMAGVYSYLPLGLRVIEKIKGIVREELNSVGAQEVELTTLQQSEVWKKTNRWDDSIVDIWFKTNLKNETTLGLAFTHEESLTVLMKNHINSYKDLPAYVYQFQSKFRNELRTKSGIMRGREFLMKDLYDFSLNKKEHEEFYEKMKGVYMKIFSRIGIGDLTYLTMSSGGSFSKYSFEFQTISDAGEDVILYDKEKRVSINKDDYSDELLGDFSLNKEDFNFTEAKSIEVGDIYNLGDKYSKALGLTYKDEKGNDQCVYMGSYGIGISRLMGAVAEVFSDDKGLVWPSSIAPFDLHIVSIGDNKEVSELSLDIYSSLVDLGINVLYDDREASAGEKLADSDLLGIPYRLIISERNMASGEIEVVERATGKTSRYDEAKVIETVTKLVKEKQNV